jgi:sugar phosphate isomerase/epimerase
MNKVMLNTAVFLNEMNAGQSQIDLLTNLSQEIDGFEVRGEFFKDNKKEELQQLMALANQHDYDFYYSIPETLFDANQLNPKISDHFQMASEFHIASLKISLGDVTVPTQEQVTVLNNLIRVTGVDLTIENEPNAHGTLSHLVEVNRTLANLGFLGGYTFDAGNWYWINEDPVEAIELLADYTTVLH